LKESTKERFVRWLPGLGLGISFSLVAIVLSALLFMCVLLRTIIFSIGLVGEVPSLLFVCVLTGVMFFLPLLTNLFLGFYFGFHFSKSVWEDIIFSIIVFLLSNFLFSITIPFFTPKFVNLNFLFFVEETKNIIGLIDNILTSIFPLFLITIAANWGRKIKNNKKIKKGRMVEIVGLSILACLFVFSLSTLAISCRTGGTYSEPAKVIEVNNLIFSFPAGWKKATSSFHLIKSDYLNHHEEIIIFEKKQKLKCLQTG